MHSYVARATHARRLIDERKGRISAKLGASGGRRKFPPNVPRFLFLDSPDLFPLFFYLLRTTQHDMSVYSNCRGVIRGVPVLKGYPLISGEKYPDTCEYLRPFRAGTRIPVLTSGYPPNRQVHGYPSNSRVPGYPGDIISHHVWLRTN